VIMPFKEFDGLNLKFPTISTKLRLS
jgi:hypothetical protein